MARSRTFRGNVPTSTHTGDLLSPNLPEAKATRAPSLAHSGRLTKKDRAHIFCLKSHGVFLYSIITTRTEKSGGFLTFSGEVAEWLKATVC